MNDFSTLMQSSSWFVQASHDLVDLSFKPKLNWSGCWHTCAPPNYLREHGRSKSQSYHPYHENHDIMMMMQLIIVSTGPEPFSIVTSTRIITIHLRNVSQLLIRIVVKCMKNITDRCFLIDCRLISTMDDDQWPNWNRSCLHRQKHRKSWRENCWRRNCAFEYRVKSERDRLLP